MIAIANVNEEWGIGKEKGILCKLRGDLAFFRSITKNKIVVYGVNTLNSFSDKKVLPGRHNIVITHDKNHIDPEFFKSLGDNTTLTIITDPDLLKPIVENFHRNMDDVYICGGESIYKQFIDKCDNVILTVNTCKEKADTYFPNLKELGNWEEIKKHNFNYMVPEKFKKDGLPNGYVFEEKGIMYKICYFKKKG